MDTTEPTKAATKPATKADNANVSSMAVSVTLIFADECHRESWLRRMGIVPDDPEDGRLADYQRRKDNTDLMFTVAPEFSTKPPLRTES